MEKEEKIFVTTGSFISTSSFLQEDRHVNTPGAAYLKKKKDFCDAITFISQYQESKY